LSATSTYYANGKLLLSGEYLVLQGAKALALPLNKGQQLTVQEGLHSAYLHWKALYNEKVWFECVLDPLGFKVISATDQDKATTLSRVFNTIKQLSPSFQPMSDTQFITRLDADPQWGFGSSSTLISVLSQWAGVNALQLNELIFNGSGFDIACAQAQGPILYQKDQPIQPVRLDYPFTDKLYLVYSGAKKSTLPEVRSFLENNKVSNNLIEQMSALSEGFAQCQDQLTFHQLIRQHEAVVGKLIRQKPIKESLFNDFQGEVKSLGAWGGDYYLFSSLSSHTNTKKYFENKGLNIIFRWSELIKS
jgi:mevalonate kinase